MKRTSATFDERSWSPSAAPMSMGPKADSADLQPVASEKSPIRPDHSHWLAGGYSQKLGGKFAQGFCDATVKRLKRVAVVRPSNVDKKTVAGQEIIPSPGNSRAPVPRIVSLGQDRLGVGTTPGA